MFVHILKYYSKKAQIISKKTFFLQANKQMATSLLGGKREYCSDLNKYSGKQNGQVRIDWLTQALMSTANVIIKVYLFLIIICS